MNAIRDDQNDAGLIELLRSADADFAPPRLPLAEDLAAAARQVAVKRDHLNRALGGGVLVVALVASVAFTVARADLNRRRISDADRARLRSELSMLSHQADADQLCADRVSQTLQHRKQSKQRAQLFAQPAPVEKLTQQRDRAAMTLYLGAKESESSSKSMPVPSERALRQYRRVVELYPKTAAAVLAQQRIDSMQPKPRDRRDESKPTYPGSL